MYAFFKINVTIKKEMLDEGTIAVNNNGGKLKWQ